jgi:hypothetical protein
MQYSNKEPFGLFSEGLDGCFATVSFLGALAAASSFGFFWVGTFWTSSSLSEVSKIANRFMLHQIKIKYYRPTIKTEVFVVFQESVFPQPEKSTQKLSRISFGRKK